MKVTIHSKKEIGDGSMYYINTVFANLKPGLYYWKKDVKNIYKVLILIGNYVVGIKQ